MKYLVLARCPSDDVPMRLFDYPAHALDYANNLSLQMVQDSPFCKLASIDVSELIAADVVAFSEIDGEVVKMQTVEKANAD